MKSPPVPVKKPTKRTVEGARRKRDRLALRKKVIQSASRDIGPLPAVLDPARKERCRLSLRSFCKIYHPHQFDRPWSPDHFKVIDKIETAVLKGGLFAMAMPRGSGKSTIAEVACEWAALYGHRRFPLLIGADISAAINMLDSLKTELETNDLLLYDFPEVVFPIRCLERIAHRAGGQTLQGVSTRIGWRSDEIVLPTVPKSPAAGVILRVAGITGGIRGMKYKRSDGESVRPDLVIIDDPQTDESAKSVSQSQARLSVLCGAVLGLAGPGQKIAGVMPCTVIRPGDMADRILDPQKHPEWNGERTKMVYAWPAATNLWEEYARIRADCLRKDGTFSAATEFYRTRRAEMDAGSRVAWESRFNEDELSGIQHAWNIRLTDEASFFAEYQNEPMPDQEASDENLTADLIVSRLSGAARQMVPPWATRITGFCDVQGSTLWWVVCAWDDDCNGEVIDYGTWPDQQRAYFTLRDAKHTIASVIKGAGLEGQIFGALDALTKILLAQRYKRQDGNEMGIELLLIDANWGESTDTVYGFCRQSSHSGLIMPSHGRYVGASTRPMDDWPKNKGERVGHNWRIQPAKRGLRSAHYDTNFWKSWLAKRWLTSPGDPGTLNLYGKDRERHRMIADHLTAEHRVRTTGRGRTVDEWKLLPGRDNHWLDGIVGAAVAASIRGMPIAPSPTKAKGEANPLAGTPMPAKSDRMSFAALQRAARDKRGG